MKPVIGLEIHIQLKTDTKLFCSCSTASFGAPPNTNICPVCTGQPGVLPVLNRKAVEQAVILGAALGSKIEEESVFARKNYFYPDLPKNYQISQYEKPIVTGGALEYYSQGEKKTCRLTRIHLEEDAGKLLHAIGSQNLDYSLVDFNRAGTPLGEMVTEPELTNSQEASDFLVALRNTLRSLGVANCDMEKGEMRCDVNVSITNPDGSFGTRVEIKNLNSFKSARDALEHEIERQKNALASGEKIRLETRLWDVKKNATVSMRSKEESSDYRYFPEPDIPPLRLNPAWVASVKAKGAMLPAQKITHYQEKIGLTLKEAQAVAFSEDASFALFFDGVMELVEKKLPHHPHPPLSPSPLGRGQGEGPTVSARTAANWILNDLVGFLKAENKSLETVGLSPQKMFDFLKAVAEKNLSSKLGKDILAKLLADSTADPKTLIEKSGLTMLSSEADLIGVVRQVIQEKDKVAQDYKSGKDSALQALIGAVMAKTRGQAHPQKLQELFQKELRN